MASPIQQIVAKIQAQETRIKNLEETCNKCEKSMKPEDVSEMIKEANKNCVTQDDIENTFQKYIQAEHNMTNQLSTNQKTFNEQLDAMKEQMAKLLTDFDKLRSEKNELESKLNTVEAQNDALRIAQNELRDSINSE